MSSNDTSFNTPWFAVSMGLLGLIVGYALATSSLSGVIPSQPTADKPSQPTEREIPTAKSVVPVDKKKDHIFGNANATISLIEYSDYECPFCQRVHGTMKQLVEEYDGKVNWVYRHYPLNFHPNAEPAAIASECIADLAGNDAFWEFSDAVFGGNWDFASIAADLGVSESAFNDCIEKPEIAKRVQDQFKSGGASGVTGTPGTIVYNNKTKKSALVSGAQSAAGFKQAIESVQ